MVRLMAELVFVLQCWLSCFQAAKAAAPRDKTLTEKSFGGQVFSVLPSPTIYNISAANTVTDWNMAVQWVVRDSNSSLIGNRVFAMTHLGIYRALQANAALKDKAAKEEAVAGYAAHLVLNNCYPQYYYLFDALLRKQIAKLSSAQTEAALTVATPPVIKLLKTRISDGTHRWLDYKPKPNGPPGTFQFLPVPITFVTMTSTLPQGIPQLSGATPFIMPFPIKQVKFVTKIPPPPLIPSKEYDAEYDLVKKWGALDSTARTKNETNLAVFWDDPYAGSAGLSAFYNQIALSTLPANITIMQTAELMAALGCAHFDTNVVVYNQKYKFGYWRPITAIREGDPHHKPDQNWTSLFVSQNNPSYPSKLGGLAGATDVILNSYYKKWNHIPSPFTISRDLPLKYPDACCKARSYATVSAATHQGTSTRIYTGQEFNVSCYVGEWIGQQVATYVLSHLN